jgi:hypothetical protein
LREGKGLGSELCSEQRSRARVLLRMIAINFYIKAGRATLDLNFYLVGYVWENIDINIGKDVYEACSEIWNIGTNS